MQTKRDFLSIGKASIYLGISIDTLRRWEKSGKLTTYRSPGGHRYFERKVLDNLFGSKYERYNLQNIKKSEEVNDNHKNIKVNKSPETSVEKTAEKPKLQVPRYIQTQRISKYDILLSNKTYTPSEVLSSDSLSIPETLDNSGSYSILNPKSVVDAPETRSPDYISKPSNIHEKKSNFPGKIFVIITSIIILIIIIMVIIINSSPKVISPIP